MDKSHQAGPSPAEEHDAVAAAEDANSLQDQGGESEASEDDAIEAAMAEFTSSTDEEDETAESSTDGDEDEANDDQADDPDEDEDEDEGDEPSGASEDEDQDGEQGSEDGSEEDEDEDGDEGDTPLHEHPKYGKRFKELNDRMKAAETGAQKFEQIQTYMQDKGLSGDDVDNVIQMAALMKNPNVGDARESLNFINQVRERLMERAGEGEIPQDLQDKVLNGDLTENQAKAEMRHRAERAEFERQQEEARNAQEQQAQEGQAEQARAQIRRVTSEVEQGWQSDPKISEKTPLIRKAIEQDIQENGRPSTLREVRLMMEAAKRSVDARPEFNKPKRKPTKTVTGGPTKKVRTEPEDPIEAGLEGWSGS